MVKQFQSGMLFDKFILPPFSIMNVVSGEWQKRSRKWKNLGIEAELGRSARAYTTQEWVKSHNKSGMCSERGDVSIFDPVLCELIYKWFNVPNGHILDPFAGGSVRGLVAGYLGYDYTGIDLAEEQIAANVKNLDTVTQQPEKIPRWIYGDSSNIDTFLKDQMFDLVFSCPPYFDLEVYSTKGGDISNMTWEQFLSVYQLIIQKAIGHLKDNRFACFVVSEIRDDKGYYRSLVSETIKAFEKCGARYYNEIILVNSVGSLPIRVTKQFTRTRKIGRHHQNVLVFFKGDTKNIENLQTEDIFQNGQQTTLI